MPIKKECKLIKKEKLKEDIYKFTIEAEEIVKEAKAGQFLEIRINNNVEPFLRRAISIYNINKEKGILEFIFRINGKGTTLLAKKQEGELIDIIGPLGYGKFKYKGYKNIAIIGGGIGIFPLYQIAKNTIENAKVDIYMGFKNKESVLLEDEFRKVSNKLVIATDDGSYGKNGYIINELKVAVEKEKPEIIFACGPLPLLKAVQKLAIEKEILCQISLEEKMGCGLGVCLGCAVEVTTGGYEHVCKQGPVFEAKKVLI